MAHTLHRNRRPPRTGFTLIEMLVVIAIIGLLFSLGGAAYQRIRVAQMVKTTEDIVNKLQGGVDDQIQVLADDARREKKTRSDSFVGLQNYCSGDLDRAEALLLYCKLKQAFPQTTAELTQTMTAPPLAGAPGFTLGGVNFPRPKAFEKLASVTGTPEQIAAACLYVAMTERSVGGKVFDSDAGTSGRHLDVPVTGGTIRVYRDAWDKPVLFFRFFQSAELDLAPYSKQAATNKDPFDPAGKLALSWPNKNLAEAALGFPTANSLFNNRNKVVLVYSYGRNGVLDNYDGDDVLGYKLRSAGARGANKP